MSTAQSAVKEHQYDEKGEFDRLLLSPFRHQIVLDAATIASLSDVAKAMCQARVTIPKHLQGSAGDCLAIVFQAQQWGMNPFAVAQKTHLVNGTLGYEAQLVNAVVSSSPLLASRINYEWQGNWVVCNGKTDKDDSRACIVSATLRGESAPRSLRVSMAQVGSVRNSPLWDHDPRQQLAYLATKRWARLHAPDALLGVYSVDELQDAAPLPTARIVATIEPPATVQDQDVKEMRAALGARFSELGWDRARQAAWIAESYPDERERAKAAADPEAISRMLDALDDLVDAAREKAMEREESAATTEDEEVPF